MEVIIEGYKASLGNKQVDHHFLSCTAKMIEDRHQTLSAPQKIVHIANHKSVLFLSIFDQTFILLGKEAVCHPFPLLPTQFIYPPRTIFHFHDNLMLHIQWGSSVHGYPLAYVRQGLEFTSGDLNQNCKKAAISLTCAPFFCSILEPVEEARWWGGQVTSHPRRIIWVCSDTQIGRLLPTGAFLSRRGGGLSCVFQ